MHKLYIDDYFIHNSDPFSVYASDPEDNNHEHCHEFAELVLVEHGHGLHVINGKPSYIQEGDIFFVNEGDYHFYDELGTLKITNVLINRRQDFHFLSNIDPLIHRINEAAKLQRGWLLPEQRNSCQSLIAQLGHSQPQNPDDMARAFKEMIFFQLLMAINQATSDISRSHTKYKLHQLIGWLQENCFEEINWEILADQFLLTKRTLYRQIKCTTGMTPEHFIKRLRLVSARAKIRESEESITDIAYMCGFSNSNHFTSCYKNVFGHTPSSERTRAQN
ncbi:helix-turn-helix domain-containing protein [Klebsiella sp. BIGb0407]|uniref:helix-turn-helix domain-containing protein n=1 Tax=Klebsiella sp. BIGb0407 TaxID=2940603 RepID=UPI002168247D|nr:helix-turn-helix domain-containing protein [Klebsiella sp. BIGb0407]MCS3431074.1 AraC family L-rhamnose operon regulatory protein RhaS [Klebsiella sp. BIGb0407]